MTIKNNVGLKFLFPISAHLSRTRKADRFQVTRRDFSSSFTPWSKTTSVVLIPLVGRAKPRPFTIQSKPPLNKTRTKSRHGSKRNFGESVGRDDAAQHKSAFSNMKPELICCLRPHRGLRWLSLALSWRLAKRSHQGFSLCQVFCLTLSKNLIKWK